MSLDDNRSEQFKEINRLILLALSSLYKLENDNPQLKDYTSDPEKIFLDRLITKRKLFTSVMNISEDEYKRLSSTILSNSKKSIHESECRLIEIRECWDCNYDMCFSCLTKLEPVVLSLIDIITKHEATQSKIV